MEYEICYLIGESKEANLDNIRPEVEEIIKKHKGTFLEGEFLRKRRLSYEINGEARGTYVARRFTVPSRDERDEMEVDYDIMGEINKELRFNQNILRFMVVKTDDLPPLKDLEGIEERSKEQFAARGDYNRGGQRNDRPREKSPVVMDKKVQAKETPAVKVAEVKEVPKVAEVKEVEIEEPKIEKADEKIETEAVEEKPKKKSKKKEEGILGDDIDEKLDEILNI